MKKRVVILLFATMAAGTIMACGNSASNEETVLATAVVAEGSSESFKEESETEMGEETIPEEETAKKEPIAEEPQENVQDNTYVNADKADDKAEIMNTPQTMFSSTEVSAENVIHNDALEPVVDGGSTKDATVSEVVEVPSYSFTNMNATMYAKSGVNVRDLPGTEGTKVGRLNEGQEIIVTGKCNESGWYRILMDGSEVYVSDSYIVSEMPVAEPEVVNQTVPVEVQGTTPVVAETTTTESSGTMPDFITYLNQQRVAAGLSQVVWDDGLAAIASTRTNEIVSDFNHGGSWSGMENIYKGCSGKSGDVFLAWNESSGHRAAMFDEQADKAACAFVKSGEFYYVVYLYNTKPYTQEEMNQKVEQGLADGSMTQTVDYNGLTTTHTTEGSYEVTDEDTIQRAMDLINQYKSGQ